MSCGKPCGCPTYRDHVLSVSISADATPTRRPETVNINQREARWHVDMPAYKRLKQDGLNPPQIDGCRKLEQSAPDATYIETGGQFTKAQMDSVQLVPIKEN